MLVIFWFAPSWMMPFTSRLSAIHFLYFLLLRTHGLKPQGDIEAEISGSDEIYRNI